MEVRIISSEYDVNYMFGNRRLKKCAYRRIISLAGYLGVHIDTQSLLQVRRELQFQHVPFLVVKNSNLGRN